MLRPDLWPRADQVAWKAAFAAGDPFDDQGPAAHWRPRSRQSIASGYGRWIGWLKETDPEALELPPADRLTEARVRRFITDLGIQVEAGGLANYVKHTFDAISVMAPDRDWEWLKTWKNRLEKQVPRRSNRSKTPDPRRLVDLGRSLMDTADLDTPHHAGLIQFRDGILIMLLALRPFRRRNIADIRLGQHLLRVGEEWMILHDASETKNHEPIEFSVPPVVLPYLEKYLAEVRPGFPGADDHDGLWASTRGRPLSEDRVYKVICRRTQEAFGFTVRPHDFRGAAATNIAIDDPENVLMAKDLLGHKTFGTTDGHYIRANSIKSGRRHHDIIARMRDDLVKRSRDGELD